MMKAVGSRELKNRLGTYLRQVREGATIVVTDRGKPVAELRAVAPAEDDEEARLHELVADGLLAPPVGSGLSDQPPLRISGSPLSKTLLEDREDRF